MFVKVGLVWKHSILKVKRSLIRHVIRERAPREVKVSYKILVRSEERLLSLCTGGLWIQWKDLKFEAVKPLEIVIYYFVYEL